MIYRIAIGTNDGKWKFDHYATPEEMKYLRVNAKGKVEKLIEEHDPYPPMRPVLFPTKCWGSGFNSVNWLNVSSTHEVEWGTHLTDWNTTIYVNDIIETIHGIGVVCLDQYGFYYKTNHGDNNMFDIAVNGVKTYYGNIHENPELIAELGGKDE